MDYTKVIASAKRHLAEFEKGVDVDPESSHLHLEHTLWNIGALIHYETHKPYFDDRYVTDARIGLDIDEVVAAWVPEWCKKFGLTIPEYWNFNYHNKSFFDSLSPEQVTEFYMSLPVLEYPNYEPVCYITQRNISSDITKAWIQKSGLPTAPVISVGFGESKVQAALDHGVNVFIDDRFSTMVEMHRAGIKCYLRDQPHNRMYSVGSLRINSINDIIEI
jgi:uncharacterized HAD superfamily protein